MGRDGGAAQPRAQGARGRPRRAVDRGEDPVLPEDPETLVKLNAAVQLGAGSLLALGRFPRLSSLLLAGSLVPTTLAGHRFWEEKDPQERYRQRSNFLKNVGLLGGLILAAVDTEGRPGLAWRAKHATHHAAEGTRRPSDRRREARLPPTPPGRCPADPPVGRRAAGPTTLPA